MLQQPFASTHFSLLRAMADGARDRKLIALGWFYERYRTALVNVLEQRLRVPTHVAEDILHDFLLERFCEADLIEKYLACLDDHSSARRRFRDYLARSICNFAIDKLRTTKRFDDLESLDDICTKIDVDVQGVINIGWYLDLLVHALRLTRQHYIDKGMQTHWEVFLRRWISPAVLATDGVPHENISQEFGLKDAKAASNILINCWHTLRKNWTAVLRQETARQFGESPESVLKDISDSLSMSKYVDARRLLLHIVSNEADVPSKSFLRPEQVSSLLGLSMNSLSHLTTTERSLIFVCYLHAPISELLCDISQFCPIDHVPPEAWPAVLDDVSIVQIVSASPPAVELIREVNRQLQRVIKGDLDMMPKEIAGVLRFLLLVSLSKEDRR